MKIREVRPCRQSRVMLISDGGEEPLLLDKRTWEESPYGVGSSLSDTQVADLLALSERNRAREKAVFLLSKRDYSRKELEQKLCREKGKYHADRAESAKQAAAYMEECGYVNDEAYAIRLAQAYSREKLYPRRRIVQKLIEKGIDRETAQTAVHALFTEDWEMALEFLKKRHYNNPVSRTETDKIVAAMARYGFAYDDIRRALRAWQEDGETHED